MGFGLGDWEFMGKVGGQAHEQPPCFVIPDLTNVASCRVKIHRRRDKIIISETCFWKRRGGEHALI